MSSDFKELNLDRTRLRKSVEEFWQSMNCQGYSYLEKSQALHQAKYTHDGLEVMVNFHLIKDGTTTINPKTGKHQDKGEELARYLKNELVEDNSKSISVSVKNIDKDKFDLLVDFLSNELKHLETGLADISVVINENTASRKVVKATSCYCDSTTLTHHLTTKNLQIQGKPLYLYKQVCYFLSEIIDLNGFIHIISKGEESNTSNTISVSKDDIENDLISLLPNAYSRLRDNTLRMIRTSYALKNTIITLDDYTCYVFPSLRALEAVIRQLFLLKDFSIEHDNKNSFREIFYKKGDRFFVRDDFMYQIENDTETCWAIEHCYNYFVQQRHELFHANEIDSFTRIIATQKEAGKIIENVVKIIEEAYAKLI